jgi:hypothetical protein
MKLTIEIKLSLFEIKKIIREKVKSLKENRYFDDESEDEFAKAERNWGGAGEPEEEFDAFEFFGDAGDAAEADIKAEFGDDEFTPFGSMEDPRMLKDLDEDIEGNSFFKPQDSEGNDIKLKSLVTSLDGSKKGRVIGFGDDGKGSLLVRVSWQWPVDMKFMEPEKMGEKEEKPTKSYSNRNK